MKIYTSCFAQLRNIPDDIVPISISLYPPKGYVGVEYKKLAPTREILNAWKRNQDEEAYTVAFFNMLNSYSPEAIFHDLQKLSNGQDCVLLCYEKTGSFCHRNLIAQWLNTNGCDVQEWRKT